MQLIKKILLIDDDDIFLYLTLKVIEEANFKGEVKTCANGKEGIEYLKPIINDTASLPDMILLDLSMPILDGWSFLEEFIQLQPRFAKKVDLYIVSSSVSPHDLLRAKNINEISDFIIKPVTKQKFIELLKKL